MRFRQSRDPGMFRRSRNSMWFRYAKPFGADYGARFSRLDAARSVAGLICHRHIIQHRSPSSRGSSLPEWSGLRGSNPPPQPWQGRALPNELNPQKAYLHGNSQCQSSTAIAVYLVPPVGIEPTTRGFSVPCSTN